jgi:hypothetical protein
VYKIYTINVLTGEGEGCQGFGNNKYIILLPLDFFPVTPLGGAKIISTEMN